MNELLNLMKLQFSHRLLQRLRVWQVASSAFEVASTATRVCRLCRHNHSFELNTTSGASGIMLA